MASDPPKVFISYSHDSPEQAQHVLELAERLRKDGIDAQLDQYVAGTPPEGWPRWMHSQLDQSDFVLLICTETYYTRFWGQQEPGTGKGVDWEGQLVTNAIYHARSRSKRFVPVFFASQDEQFIPEPLPGYTQYLLNSEENYTKLYAFLTGQAGVTPGELGSLKALARNPVEPLRFGAADAPTRRVIHNLPFPPRRFTTSKGSTRRPSRCRGGRWRFGKRSWARSTPRWRHPWKTTHYYYEPWAGRLKQRRLKLARGPFGIRVPD